MAAVYLKSHPQKIIGFQRKINTHLGIHWVSVKLSMVFNIGQMPGFLPVRPAPESGQWSVILPGTVHDQSPYLRFHHLCSCQVRDWRTQTLDGRWFQYVDLGCLYLKNPSIQKLVQQSLRGKKAWIFCSEWRLQALHKMSEEAWLKRNLFLYSRPALFTWPILWLHSRTFRYLVNWEVYNRSMKTWLNLPVQQSVLLFHWQSIFKIKIIN